MTRKALHNAIRARFKTQVTDVVGVSTAYDNALFTPPNHTAWMRLNIRPGQTLQETFGGNTNLFRTRGEVIVQIILPMGQGDEQALEIARVIELAFRQITDSGVKFTSPWMTTIGQVEGKYQVNVTCPFSADDFT